MQKRHSKTLFVSYANATWTGTGKLTFGVNTQFSNSGIFDIQTAGSIDRVEMADPEFVNTAAGTLKKTTGEITVFNVDFKNHNNVEFSSGTVWFTQDAVQVSGVSLLNGGNFWTTTPFKLQGGKLEGVGTITGSVENTGGNVQPLSLFGRGGLLTITDNYTQGAGGTLTIALKDTRDHGRLRVQGTVSLNGTLQVNKDAAYQPGLGTDLVFLEWGSRNGDFSTINITNNSWTDGTATYLFVPLIASTYYHLEVQTND